MWFKATTPEQNWRVKYKDITGDTTNESLIIRSHAEGEYKILGIGHPTDEYDYYIMTQ